MQILTHSRLSCFRTCPRKHWMRYELGLHQETDDSLPRKFGSLFHKLCELEDKGLGPDLSSMGLDDDPYLIGSVLATFTAHQRQYQGSGIKPVEAELEFNRPIINPSTGRSTPNWTLAGVIDRIVELPDGRLALMEYKTTSLDFSPGAEYWQRLHLDQQLSIYIIAARELGFDIQTVLYDVTRRPMLRPKMATPKENWKYKKNGELYANIRTDDETPEEFTARVAEDIKSRPDHYFSRIEIARLESDLDECQNEIWQQQLAVRASQKSGFWYRNPGACFGFHTCEYLPICQYTNLETETPQGFTRSANVHQELTQTKESE